MKRVICPLLTVLMLLTLIIPCMASQGIVPIEAYLNKDTNIVYNKIPIPLLVNGNNSYVIVYQGVTYVPVIALTEAMGLDYHFDKGSNTFFIGEVSRAVDFIDGMVPYAFDGDKSMLVTSSKRKETVIAGENQTHWINLSYSSKLYYDLGGKYKTLTFSLYSEHDEDFELYGDNGVVLFSTRTVPKQLPRRYTVDVANIIQLEVAKIQNRNGANSIFMFNAIIE